MDDSAKFHTLGPSELAWLDQQRLSLQNYILELLPSSSQRPSAEVLDDLWMVFRSSEIGDNAAAMSFVQALGVGFGDLLVDHHGFNWVILEDEYGTEIAVRALPGTANTRVAPIDFVKKRYENEVEDAFIMLAAEEIGEFVEKQRREWESSENA